MFSKLKRLHLCLNPHTKWEVLLLLLSAASALFSTFRSCYRKANKASQAQSHGPTISIFTTCSMINDQKGLKVVDETIKVGNSVEEQKQPKGPVGQNI